eukprot:3326510-Prymnesium_polylepis.2
MLPPKLQFKRRARAEANRLAAIARRAKTIPCRLVGRAFYGRLALCPSDAIRVAREADNAHDANAHAVSVYTDGGWAGVGYVDRQTAARLALYRICDARIVGSGPGALPIEVDVA